jgi:hypothetical protein
LVSRSRADSVFVSVGAARFRFTRSLLLVVVPCWTGSDLFLSSRREQVRTDGEEPELPSSFSAVVPFASHFPFALFASRKPARASAQSGRKSSPFFFEEAGSCLCSVWAQIFALFASRKPARASAQSGRKSSSLPLSGSSCISFSRVPSVRFTSGLVLRFHRCSIFLLILSPCSASRPVSLLDTFASHGANSQRRRCLYRVYFWRVQCSSSAALHFMVQLL